VGDDPPSAGRADWFDERRFFLYLHPSEYQRLSDWLALSVLCGVCHQRRGVLRLRLVVTHEYEQLMQNTLQPSSGSGNHQGARQ
jgi:hypothetical protein